MKAVAIWFRFEDRMVSDGVDEFDNPLGPGHLEVALREYEVAKETPKGVWLRSFMTRRFVLRGARKQFACATIEQALASYLARKRKQASIYEKRATRAVQAGMLAEQKTAELMRDIHTLYIRLDDWVRK